MSTVAHKASLITEGQTSLCFIECYTFYFKKTFKLVETFNALQYVESRA